MSTPETVVAALALALTSLALLRALAQNGKGRGCLCPSRQNSSAGQEQVCLLAKRGLWQRCWATSPGQSEAT